MHTVVKAPTSPLITELEAKNRLLAREAAIEGMVLLQNDGCLPLQEKRLALYGTGARMTVKGGRGSGEVRDRCSISIAEGLENEGFDILTRAWLDGFDRFYQDSYETYRRDCEKKVEGLRDFSAILHAVPPFVYPTGMPLTEEDLADCGTAVYVLSRQAGEGHDRLAERADYYLSEVEEENLRFLRAHYRRLILIINVGGLIDLSILDEVPVNALVYFVQGGEEGGNALAKLLTGERCFSGKLSTTWPRRLQDVPSGKNYSYFSNDKCRQDYDEGIYVGYRYYDRFGVNPRFPFGFGMSYTSFGLKYGGIRFEKGRFLVDVELENRGRTAGKEIVELYTTLPGEDSELKRLVGFEKSSLLAPAAKETLTLCVGLRELSVYDEARAAWLLRAGSYRLLLGKSAADTLPVFRLSLSEDYLLEQCNNICPLSVQLDELEAPEKPADAEDSLPTAALDPWVPEPLSYAYGPVTEPVDPLLQKLSDRELCTLVIGATTSPKNTQVSALGADGSTTPLLYDSFGIPNVLFADGPAGLNLTPHIVQLPDGSVKAARVPINLEAYKRYLFGFSGAVLTSQMAKPEDGVSHYQYATAWPASQLLAQSFNRALLEQIGDAVGSEMDAFGVTVWLAPGMNIHRHPLLGRTFEYYSEDPLLSGRMAAALVRGVQSHPGKGVSIKHFVANNCELERNRSSSNLREKVLREIYLRGFEIAVRESAPATVMASYNLVNGLHAVNNYDLLTRVLRNEWGFAGMVMSDWDSMKASPKEPCVPLTGDVQKAHRAGLDLVCPGRPDQIEALLLGLTDGCVRREDLERAGARVLRLIRFNSVLASK